MSTKTNRKKTGRRSVFTNVLTVLIVLGVAGAAVFFYVFGGMQKGKRGKMPRFPM